MCLGRSLLGIVRLRVVLAGHGEQGQQQAGCAGLDVLEALDAMQIFHRELRGSDAMVSSEVLSYDVT